jgi:hypothetical protein
MPFKNQDQREACYAQEERDKKAGRKPAWDCAKWEKETPSRIPGMKKEAGGRFVAAFQDAVGAGEEGPGQKGLRLTCTHSSKR